MGNRDAHKGCIYLVKANNDVLSFCACKDALISYPPQASCPWCGCGWMFACMGCRKCFTFARAVRRDESLEELVRRDVAKWFGARKVARKEVEELVAERMEWFAWALEGVEAGREYVIIDGHLHDTAGKGPWEFEGWFARHAMKLLPQVRARRDPRALKMLENVEYWTLRERG